MWVVATRGPAAAQIVLTDDERAELEGWTPRRTSAAGLALRARIVLPAADGGTDVEWADRLGLDRGTIRKWRNRFAELCLDGLLDEPGPGRARVIGGRSDQRVDHRHFGDHATGGPRTGQRPYVWTKAADQIIESIANYCRRINDSGH